MSSGERGPSDRPALARLLPGPPDSLSPERFGAEHWDRLPLFTRAASLPGGFGDLFSADAVDELVTRRGLRTPFVRMARAGTVLDPARYTAPGGLGAEIADQVSADKVLDEFTGGATLVLQGLHRTWPAVAEFTRRLVADLGHPVQVNAYVTPASERGFDPHYDVHDVFVIQILGEKRWRIHPSVYPRPLRDQPWTDHREAVDHQAQGVPFLDEVFRPNDVLYLPRGWIHSATALGGTSIHLTIGVAALTRHDVLREAIIAAANDETLRAALPLGVDLTDAAAARTLVAEVVKGLTRFVTAEPERADAVARRLALRVRDSSRPEPIAPLATTEAATALHEATTVSLRHGLDARLRPGPRDREVSLLLPGKSLTLPAEATDALTQVLAGGTVQAGGLDGLDTASSLVVARRLVREGVLVVR
ncbi:cupin domain-containing protein [Cryobacterium sp. SO2]|uniref:cupin domain-containing protein n=1 Tax=Cryobacterium sp. SO2 TaxID=1897060 RepID=UPI00223D7CB5|nr:cupin domain-containing protein [Cryobacterium sp. SO2]WEO78897.1 cupin domain-containing protein [Cryobacterium sp. SO2]